MHLGLLQLDLHPFSYMMMLATLARLGYFGKDNDAMSETPPMTTLQQPWLKRIMTCFQGSVLFARGVVRFAFDHAFRVGSR
jgi:hypothetical protein